MVNKNEFPGHITACKQVMDRVYGNESPSDRITVSATSRCPLHREKVNRPENEDRIRGIEPLRMHSGAVELAMQDDPILFQRAVDLGLVVVV